MNQIIVKSEIKNENGKESGFDARCYGNMLFVKSKFNSLFKNLNIELLPVSIDSKESDFSFLNVLTVIEAIDLSNLDYQQSMEMLKSDNIAFIKRNINDIQVFRDKKLINFYYCSALFKNLFEMNNIKGLSFIKVGEAR